MSTEDDVRAHDLASRLVRMALGEQFDLDDVVLRTQRTLSFDALGVTFFSEEASQEEQASRLPLVDVDDMYAGISRCAQQYSYLSQQHHRIPVLRLSAEPRILPVDIAVVSHADWPSDTGRASELIGELIDPARAEIRHLADRSAFEYDEVSFEDAIGAISSSTAMMLSARFSAPILGFGTTKTPMFPFTVHTRTVGLRVHWFYPNDYHPTFFKAPTTPVTSYLTSTCTVSLSTGRTWTRLSTPEPSRFPVRMRGFKLREQLRDPNARRRRHE